MKEEFRRDDFIARLEDMCALAEKRRQPVFSSFLNDREQFQAEKLLGKRAGTDILFWGGHEDCVRRILRVSSEDSFAVGGYDDFPVYPVSLAFRKADKPGHRDFLGAFMGLGIKRETVGDIFIGEGAAAVFCTKTARDMICDSVTSVGRVGVSASDGLSEAALAAVKPAAFEEITVNAASERADCIIGGITGLSREKTASLIRAGSFMLNYSECTNISRNVSDGDILTVRGYGKFVVSGEPEMTKKGRIRLTIKKYI